MIWPVLSAKISKLPFESSSSGKICLVTFNVIRTGMIANKVY